MLRTFRLFITMTIAAGSTSAAGREHRLSAEDVSIDSLFKIIDGPFKSIREFGVLPENDPATNTANLQKAIDWASRSGAALFVEPSETPYPMRSEEHTSELQSLMRNSYAVFCLTKKNVTNALI